MTWSTHYRTFFDCFNFWSTLFSKSFVSSSKVDFWPTDETELTLLYQNPFKIVHFRMPLKNFYKWSKTGKLRTSLKQITSLTGDIFQLLKHELNCPLSRRSCKVQVKAWKMNQINWTRKCHSISYIWQSFYEKILFWNFY